MKNEQTKVGTQEQNAVKGEEKGFIAFLEIYGRKEIMSKTYAHFSGDKDKLTKEDKESIIEYLTDIANVDYDEIEFVNLDIIEENDLNEELED